MIVPAGSRVRLVRRAWGLRTRTIERQRAVPHYEGRVVAVELPPGTELNCDGELRAGGLERVTAPKPVALATPRRASADLASTYGADVVAVRLADGRPDACEALRDASPPLADR